MQGPIESASDVVRRAKNRPGLKRSGRGRGLAYGTGAPATAPMIRALGERFVLGKDPNYTETIWEQMLHRSF
ncbi:MAG: hypothetical protein AB7U95_22270 [Reyranella sp.]